ncbi:DUF1304 domain-containing protein [Staphylococcus edaphicus]|uniref:DUF1304 family protein n=1 Tax=Staphylococcus edaphicus TaxID=1955013 RepID=A0A2C6VDQ9_9STAP|nr:DUF1304 family protein [Staphylococcus edaphicus]PHK48471.1 hypothetical protein BTJ66_13330 [Staphylococcus edaphicus]UQW81486.1 DUF1304 family protein [Staphylococcus edaphicus]
MSTISYILTLFVAAEFFYIMILQTFATTSNKTSNLFKMSKAALKQENLNTLMKNQDVYNGLLGLLLLYALFLSNHATELISCILIYMILVALYGALTSQKSILLKQGGLPIIALMSLLF